MKPPSTQPSQSAHSPSSPCHMSPLSEHAAQEGPKWENLLSPSRDHLPSKVQPLPTTSLWHFRRDLGPGSWVPDASMSVDLTDQLWEQQRRLQGTVPRKVSALLRGLPALFSPTPSKA